MFMGLIGVFPKWSLRVKDRGHSITKGMFVRVPTVLEVALKGRWPLYRHGADPPQELPYRHFFCGIPYLFLLWPFSTSQHFLKDYFFPRARSKVDPRAW